MKPHVVGAWLIGAVVAGVLIVSASGGDVDRMTFGDGVFFRYISEHLTTPLEDVDPFVVSRGASYRYGRIGLPALMWASAAGRHEAIRWVQPILMVIAAGFAAAAAGVLFPRFGPAAALIPFAAIGFTLSLPGGFPEPVSVAFLLWAVVCVQKQRWWPAAVLFAIAMLTRETVALPMIGVLIWVAIRHGRRPALVLATSVLPTVAWHLFVSARYGHLPLLDPWNARQGGSVVPLRGIWQALSEESTATAMLIVVHIAIGIAGILVARSSVVGAAAAASAVQLLWVPRLTFDFPGDTVRVFIYIEIFVVLALVEIAHRRAATIGGPQPVGVG